MNKHAGYRVDIALNAVLKWGAPGPRRLVLWVLCWGRDWPFEVKVRTYWGQMEPALFVKEFFCYLC